MLISLEEAKKFARIDEKYDDSVTAMFLRAAADTCTEWTGYPFFARKRVTDLVVLNRAGEGILKYRPNYEVTINIPGMKPFDTVARDRMITVNTGQQHGWIVNPFGCDQTAGPQLSSVRVSYETGFGCYEDIPAALIHGIFAYVTWSYEHRGDEPIIKTQRPLGGQGQSFVGMYDQRIVRISGAWDLWYPFMSGIRM